MCGAWCTQARSGVDDDFDLIAAKISVAVAFFLSPSVMGETTSPLEVSHIQHRIHTLKSLFSFSLYIIGF